MRRSACRVSVGGQEVHLFSEMVARQLLQNNIHSFDYAECALSIKADDVVLQESFVYTS